LRAAAFLVLLTAVALMPAVAQAPRLAHPVERLAIQSQAIEAFDPREPARAAFGKLSFRGGLVLESSHRDFGGLSGLRFLDNGERFLAVTDKGHWLRGRLVYRDGRPIAVADAEIAPILGPDGQPRKRRPYDAESLSLDGGTAYAGMERINQILRFDYGKDGLRARGHPIALPPAMKRLPFNKGLECLAMAPKDGPLADTLIAISEHGLDARGNLLGFLIPASGGAGGMFLLRRTDDFDVSDCAVSPRGELLVLERRFTWVSGVAMRIRSVPLGRIRPGTLLDGTELIFADMGYQIDNMEALAVHRASDGALVLTLVSDDNFSSRSFPTTTSRRCSAPSCCNSP
jgi:hypothetical protein